MKTCDSISRQDAVSEIDEWIQMATGNGTDMAIKDFLSFLKERIESLPSAEPKTGKWITNIYKYGKERYVCSNCGGGHTEDSDFCPHCGSYNRW